MGDPSTGERDARENEKPRPSRRAERRQATTMGTQRTRSSTSDPPRVAPKRSKGKLSFDEILKALKLPGLLFLWVRDKWGYRVIIALGIGLIAGFVLRTFVGDRVPWVFSREGWFSSRTRLESVKWQIIKNPEPVWDHWIHALAYEGLGLTEDKQVQAVLRHTLQSPTKPCNIVLHPEQEARCVTGWLFRETRDRASTCFIALGRVPERASVEFRVPACHKGDSLTCIVVTTGPRKMSDDILKNFRTDIR